MKLLRFKINSGFLMLEKGFEVSFLTKTRIDKNKENSDLLLLEDDFYYPIETIFIGKNSSGKSTTLRFIQLLTSFIGQGRINVFSLADTNDLDFECDFYDKGMLYRYHGSFAKNLIQNSNFFIIQNESLKASPYRKTHNKELSNVVYSDLGWFMPNIGGDTSGIRKLGIIDASVLCDSISTSDSNLATIVTTLKKLYGNNVFNILVKMFDDSVEKFDVVVDSMGLINFKFKRLHKNELTTDLKYIVQRLSGGTYRGIYIYAASLIAFKYGGHILIDEIEKSFNKNLVGNLISLFNDKTINKSGASLIYSTHYSELLDESDRCDNINVLHRNGDSITVKNMHTHYSVRTDLSKSNQFDQNAFDNFLNYEQLVELRRAIIK